MEKVSLVVAAYNIERYIETCLESCVRQTDKNVEIIVVNDGSIDGTTDILKKFKKESGVRIIQHRKNKGLSEARKTGFRAAGGKYVLFVDGDDWLEETAVEYLRMKAEDLGTDILCFSFFLEGIKENVRYPLEPFGTEEKDAYLNRLLTGRFPPSIFSKFLRRSYIKENKVAFPASLNCGEDVALSASLGLFNPRAALIEKALYHYRISPDSLSAAPTACMLDILPATRFVEAQLKKTGLYDGYRMEFEYYAFLHNLFYRFDAMFTRPNPYREQLHENWESLGINMADNPYFQQNFSEPTPKNELMRSLFS